MKTKIIGHRGAKAVAPENTLVGFAYAQSLVSAGLAGVEFDVQLTKDGELAVFHDDDCIRCCGRQLRIDQLCTHALAHIIQQRLFHQFRASLPSAKVEGITTMAAVVPLLSGYQHIELEVKTHERSCVHKLVQALFHAYHAQQLGKLPITLTSFNAKLLYQLKQAKFPLPTGLLLESLPIQETIATAEQCLIQQAQKLGCVQVGLYEVLITESLVQTLRHHGIAVTAWTVNNPHRAKQLEKWQVNHVITDNPCLLLP